MDRAPDFHDSPYDTSDDSSVDSSNSDSEVSPQRPRRGCCQPIQNNLFESDDSSIDSEDDYIPNPEEESTDSDHSIELPTGNPKKNNIVSISQTRRKSSNQSRTSETSQTPTHRLPESRANENEDKIVQTNENEDKTVKKKTDKEESVSMPLEEESSVFVNPVLKKEDGSRRYNKKHSCFYCGLAVQKMSRHLANRHSDKADVAKALSMPKNSKGRRLQLDYIRNRGNFEHNTEVLESQKGKLIPWKQPKEKTEGQKFMHCVYCYGLFTRKVMWRHFQDCKFKPKEKPSKLGKTRVQSLCAFAESAPTGLSSAYWKFLSDMNQDKFAVTIKEDRFILEYGYRLFNKYEKVLSQHQFIRQNLRELGRLIVEVKKVTPVKSIKELIKPEKYGLLVTATRCLAGFNEETGQYQRPSIARKVGHRLHSLAIFIKSEGLKMKDQQATQDAEGFAKLYQQSWKSDISSKALSQLYQTKWNSPLLLPFTQDVQSLHCHVSEKQRQHFNALKEEPLTSNWKELAKVTLAQIILFNRQTVGVVSRIPLSTFSPKGTLKTGKEIKSALLLQNLCKLFDQITIVGKRGSKVPLLLTQLMKDSLNFLIEKREECGVLKENKYLFALPHSVHHLSGAQCIKQFVNECDAIKTPKVLISMKFKKHMATISTVLNLRTTELDQLADFLGNNYDLKRRDCPPPEGTVNLAKISKVLLSLEQGRPREYRGKSLEEIHLDVNETIDLEGCSQEDMKDASMQEAQESEDEVSVTSSRAPNKRKTARKRGKQTAVKRSWTPEECAAVERHLHSFIERNQVPGKTDCQNCLSAEPGALVTRDWKAVKYFIKNRITAMRRKGQ